jgi:murein DD-endopeptidase MepM/ murein hydrolase activator NlpD
VRPGLTRLRLAGAGLAAVMLAGTPALSQDAPDTTDAAAPRPSTGKAVAREKFRWPLRGPILQGFKAGENEGIDIKSPVGEPVHAAADGVCTYAGDELKSYGMLILIRHPDGYVTAYANNSELLVKEGDRIRRGQIIAKSGDSGGVSSPRLHFELRKDGKALDPTKSLVPL